MATPPTGSYPCRTRDLLWLISHPLPITARTLRSATNMAAANTTATTWLLAALLGFCAVHQIHAAAVGENLSYIKGGSDWGGVCESGTRQSPVNLLTKDMKPMRFFKDMVRIDSLGVYDDLRAFITPTLPHFEVHLASTVTKANATIPATAEGNIFLPLSEPYDRSLLTRVQLEPKQFHYHVHSESAIDGEFHDGVIHIVTFVKEGESAMCDRIKIAGGLGCPVVLSIFLTMEKTHSEVHDQFFEKNTAVEEEFELLVGEKPLITKTGEENGVDVLGEFDLTELLPSDGKYATWEGSLTTHPCTEGVLWISFLTPVGINEETVEKLKNMITLAAGEDCEAISNGLCTPPRPPLDSRDIQPLNGRAVRTGKAFYN